MSSLITDSVHGTIELENDLFKFIDTAQLQRLRNLSQLGTTNWVFPGASHNRYAHCIGTCHLAGKMVSTLQIKQPELNISDHDKYLVKVAGLCHDLGHGPFSHMFDNEFVPLITQKPWTHENMSIRMLEHLVEDNDISIEDSDLKFIQSLIDPKNCSIPHQFREKKYLYDIISNTRNGIDVDKFDYVRRDCHYIGMNSSFDDRRLMNLCRVVDQQICFHEKEVYDVYELFHMRYRLFREVYSHNTSKAVELMICDILYHANPLFKFSEIVESEDPKLFMRMTDGLLTEIEFNANPTLKQSQDIIKRLQTRDLYHCVDELLVEDIKSLENSKRLEKFTSKNIANYCTDGVKPSDLIVKKTKLDYGMNGNKNPVLTTKFYSSKNPNSAYTIVSDDVSYLLPAAFEETHVRLFVRDSSKSEAAFKGFNKLVKEVNI